MITLKLGGSHGWKRENSMHPPFQIPPEILREVRSSSISYSCMLALMMVLIHQPIKLEYEISVKD